MSYSITNVGALSTFGAMPVVNGLNNRGAVIGTSQIAMQEKQYPYMTFDRGFVYTHGTISSVGTLGGNSNAQGINDRGAIVGVTTLFPTNPSSLQMAVFIRRGRMSELTPLNQKWPVGQISINNRGEVTGFPASNGNDLLLRNGKRINIGSLGGGDGSVALALSNSGEVVGRSVVSGFGTSNVVTHAFAYTGGKMIDLGSLGGTFSEGEACNNHGVVVGDSLLAGDQIQNAYVYRNGVMTDLGTLGGTDSIAHSINDRGVIVGSSNTASGQMDAFIDQNGVMTDMNSLIPANSGYVLSRGIAINNKGQIVVQAYSATNPDGPTIVLRLNPTGH